MQSILHRRSSNPPTKRKSTPVVVYQDNSIIAPDQLEEEKQRRASCPPKEVHDSSAAIILGDAKPSTTSSMKHSSSLPLVAPVTPSREVDSTRTPSTADNSSSIIPEEDENEQGGVSDENSQQCSSLGIQSHEFKTQEEQCALVASHGSPLHPKIPSSPFTQQAILLSGVIVASSVSFVCSIMSYTAICSLLAAMSSSGLLIFAGGRHVYKECCEAIENGNGLGPKLLPEGIYKLLTQQSLHEYLSPPTKDEQDENDAENEEATGWSHLILYFLPGISKEQLDSYINRLGPRQRQQLKTPGLGHFLGPQFMRILVGDEGLTNLALAYPFAVEYTPPNEDDDDDDSDSPPMREIETTSVDNDRKGKKSDLLFDDDDSSMGIEISADDFAGGMSEQQALATGTALKLKDQGNQHQKGKGKQNKEQKQNNKTNKDDNEKGGDDQNNNDEYTPLEQVLMDAMYESYMNTVYIPLYNFMLGSVAQPASSKLVKYGLGITFVAGITGAIGYWQGFSRPALYTKQLHFDFNFKYLTMQNVYKVTLASAATAICGSFARGYFYSKDTIETDEDNEDNQSKSGKERAAVDTKKGNK